MTAFRRRLRLRQARWREAQGLPIGHQPYQGGEGAREIGSHIELDYAERTRANLVTDAAKDAASNRVTAPEPFQNLWTDRLWADLLSSMPMCFNLFGDLAASTDLADAAVHAWWPDTPTRVKRLRFEWSPGRRSADYLGNQSAFDAAVFLDLGGYEGVVGIETKYHEHAAVEDPPSGERLERYLEVSERSQVFVDHATSQLIKTDLQQLWQDHLLVLSMLQRPGQWEWGRFVLVYPAGNSSFAGAASRYAELLRDDLTFRSVTLEDLLAAEGALLQQTVAAFTERYLGG